MGTGRRSVVGALAALERLASRRLGLLVLFTVALAVWVVRAAAWPLITGRDLDDYLRYYAQLFDDDPLLPAIVLSRTPLTPIVDGLSLDVAGGALAEPLLAVLFALSVTAWAVAAFTFGPRAALAVALVLLLYPAYGVIFHELSSEPVFAATFAGWGLLFTRAAVRPSWSAFAALGAGVAVLTLVRPGNQALLVMALFPLLLPGRVPTRLLRAAAFLAAGILVLAGWALLNGARYGEYTLARGGETAFFHHALVVDRIVEPENGPATRKLTEAIEAHLLTREPYRSYGVTLDDVLSSGSLRVSEDIGVLADQLWGWNGGPDVLQEAGAEALRAHPRRYAAGVLRTLWLELSEPYYRVPPGNEAQDGTTDDAGAAPAGTLPPPSEGDVIPGGQNGWIVRPDHAIRQVWTSPTEYHFEFATPGAEQRFAAIERRLEEFFARLPTRTGNRTLAVRLNQAGRWYPRPIVWLLLGLAALAWRRPARSLVLLGLAAAGMIVVGATALVAPADIRYMLPVAPTIVVLAFGSLLGPRPRRGHLAHVRAT